MTEKSKINILVQNISDALKALDNCSILEEIPSGDWEDEILNEFKSIVSDVCTKLDSLKLAVTNISEYRSKNSKLENRCIQEDLVELSEGTKGKETDEADATPDKIEKPIIIKIKNRRVVTDANEENSIDVNDHERQARSESITEGVESEDVCSSGDDILDVKHKNKKSRKNKKNLDKSKNGKANIDESNQNNQNSSDVLESDIKKTNPPENDKETLIENQNDLHIENGNLSIESNLIGTIDCERAEDSMEPNKDANDSNIGEDSEKSANCLENHAENNEQSQKTDLEFSKPLIKLVDIKKLMAPGAKPISADLDNSVIILTSSDEELRKESTKDSSSSLTKDNSKKTNRKNFKLEQSTIDIDSSDPNCRNHRTTRRRKDIKAKSRIFNELVAERTRLRKKKSLELGITSDSESESSKKVNKKMRNRKVEAKSTTTTKTNIEDKVLQKTSIKNNELAEESGVSDRSDNDSLPLIERVQKSTKDIIRRCPHERDLKFKSRVYIPLPKFRCEDLPNLYLYKKELLKIKRITDIDFASNGDSPPLISVSEKVDKPKSQNCKRKVCVKNSEHLNSNTRISQSEEKDLTEKENQAFVEMPQIVQDGDTSDNEKQSNKENCKLNTGHNVGDKSEEVNVKEKKRKRKNDGSCSEGDEKTQTSKLKKEKLLTEKLNSSDSEGEITKSKRKTDMKIKKKKIISDSESDCEGINTEDAIKQLDDNISNESDKEPQASKKLKKKIRKVISDSESDTDKSKSSSESEHEQTNKNEPESKNASRRRVKRTKESSSSEDEDKSTRKTIRRMLDKDSLSETTKQAEADEKERKIRIAEKQKKYNEIFQLKSDAAVEKVILDFDEKEGKELLCVSKKLVKHLKPHQVNGVKFMWDACFESLERVKKNEGSGCILAHCMGLGKTLQVITLSHTLLTNKKKTQVEKIMVVCPVNTVLNWKAEFKKWLPEEEFEIFDLVSCKTSSVNYERSNIVQEWHEDGGVLIIGYNMFRNLSNPVYKAIPKKLRHTFQKGLVDPGPDLVVCDEGHLLKNEKTNLSIAMNRIKTSRRIVLTGTPLQNNLKEYWCMVQFIKPNLLGTYKEYLNRFVNPIINGQYTDSTPHDISIMRKRSHVLHKLLDGVVQRQDYAVLAPYLPPKYEYVLFIKLSEVQAKLYMHYMKNFAQKRIEGSRNTSFLFTDFQELQRICTHPRVLLDKSVEDKDKNLITDEEDSEGSLKDFIDDGTSEEEESSGTSTSESGSASDSDNSLKKNKKKKKKSKATRLTRAQRAQKRENGDMSDSDVEISGPKMWWQEFIDGDELNNLNHSSKLFLLSKILTECEEIGDKVLVFSQSLYTLNCIEYFLQKIDDASQSNDTEKLGGHASSWSLGLDYFRLDGSSSCDNRAAWCDSFNNPENTRARLFLISTKAGGLGINLVAANRVIIFDVSWNPSHDIQSIYRVYRFGQTKPCYIYRFVCYGAMEMKIYERQVTKQAISKRVIDEQQIDRHYSQNDIMELYKVDLDPKDRPIPLVPKDVLLGELLQNHENILFKYHEHQSLLENKEEECLNEEERKAAWEEFENEKVMRKNTVTNFGGITGMQAFNNTLAYSPQIIQVALANIVRKDNPTWSEIQIKGILPALVQQLQMQLTAQDYTMYNRVQQEIKLMQAVQAQRMREQYFQHQIQQMIQKQQLQNQMLGNLNVDPSILSRQVQGGGSSHSNIRPVQNPVGRPQRSTAKADHVIELND
ncbi:transcriptional regulator ATRX homolog [Cylas formicarius]|uniref:transcriptional regulator ATRX homolog n=1 Tax=Cylas formicarius TaxID=197179 RepID=UPI0029586721|nr:transcriptional regulator ATRX homolog [Cylas formicarius]XP_060536176.1 transcriptional regulator ATRX homolog [Cylas formicarius]